MAMYLCNVGNSSDGGVIKPIFSDGVLYTDIFNFDVSQSRPNCEISGNYIICTESSSSTRNGFKLTRKDTSKLYNILIIFEVENTSNARYQYGTCITDADPYLCAATGAGRNTFNEGNLGAGNTLKTEYNRNTSDAFFVDFTNNVKIIGIYYLES